MFKWFCRKASVLEPPLTHRALVRALLTVAFHVPRKQVTIWDGVVAVVAPQNGPLKVLGPLVQRPCRTTQPSIRGWCWWRAWCLVLLQAGRLAVCVHMGQVRRGEGAPSLPSPSWRQVSPPGRCAARRRGRERSWRRPVSPPRPRSPRSSVDGFPTLAT